MSALISITGVAKRYATDRGEVVAVQDVDLEVRQGSFVALLGPSGCGKSTLLRMVAGLDAPSEGRILLDGQDVVAPTAMVGFMFQHSLLFPWRSVIENVLLPVDIARGKRAEHLDRAHALLASVGLEEFAHHRPNELSGGMQQRAALCRALIVDPPVLLLDEPFGALDSITREELNDLLLQICHESGKTTLLVTHDVEEAVYLADEVVVMSSRPGRISDVVGVELGYPRDTETRNLPEFRALATRLRKGLGIAHRQGRAAR
ncbi:MAG: ABC transporter ATP-binding protein [Nocardioidaceae bacterium]|nr:ABC transporter ATP-binding protein [Nocardioidaceae bacterium]